MPIRYVICFLVKQPRSILLVASKFNLNHTFILTFALTKNLSSLYLAIMLCSPLTVSDCLLLATGFFVRLPFTGKRFRHRGKDTSSGMRFIIFSCLFCDCLFVICSACVFLTSKKIKKNENVIDFIPLGSHCTQSKGLKVVSRGRVA